MKFLNLALSATAVLALAASPSPAATRHHHHYGRAYGYYGRPLDAGGVSSPGPIYRQGYYLGTDPDPRIREEIVRDPWFGRK
jgi:hypothetical protein